MMVYDVFIRRWLNLMKRWNRYGNVYGGSLLADHHRWNAVIRFITWFQTGLVTQGLYYSRMSFAPNRELNQFVF